MSVPELVFEFLKRLLQLFTDAATLLVLPIHFRVLGLVRVEVVGHDDEDRWCKRTRNNVTEVTTSTKGWDSNRMGNEVVLVIPFTYVKLLSS